MAIHPRLSARSRWATRPRFVWLVVGVGVVFGPGAWQWGQLQWQRRSLEARLRAMEADHQALQVEQARLQDDPAYVEGLVRSTFKVAKPGELVVPLDDASTKSH